MGIIGPFFGFIVWKALIKGGVKIPVGLAIAALFADLMTYVVTAIQMTLNHGQSVDALVNFLTNYAATQIPLAIVEAILFFMFGIYLMSNKPEVFDIAMEESATKEAAEA